jgi:zinc finger CCHC domain-containing protein 8
MKQLIDIKFKNKRTFLAFQDDFVKLIKKYYSHKLDDLDIFDDISETRIVVSEKVVKKTDAFIVDTTPNYKHLTSKSESTPSYKSSSVMLTDEIEETKQNLTSSKQSCFNCDKSTHGLRDCPEPRNFRKINKARNEFRQKESRYHVESDNKYGNLKPGEISNELREALGVNENEIPLHVYRMRMCGYPTAWLEEAKVQDSGLSMFIQNDTNLNSDGDVTEENGFKYDIQKIHDFPGFNVDPPTKFIDMFQVYNVFPMMPVHSKEMLIKSLGENIVDGYTKIKTKDEGEADDTKGDEDMELDSDNENHENLNQPREELEEGEVSDDDELPRQQRSRIEIQQVPQVERNDSFVFIQENSENENRDNLTVENEKLGEVDSTIPGCPVLPSFSGFSNLPQGEKFKEGVSDVIAFENLAESTGKYEKMKHLLKKVKQYQNELNEKTDE